MTDPTAPPPHRTRRRPDHHETSPVGRAAIAAVLVAMLVMWAWIWFFAPRDNVDRFSGRAFPDAAEPVCAAAHERIDALPSGQETPTVEARAAAVREATEILEAMIAELESLAPLVTDPDDTNTLQLWFDDWHTRYLADRWAHVERLETATPDTPDEDLAFLVQDLAYGRKIDGLANVNDMPSCVLPGDI